MACNTVAEKQFLIELISSDLRQIITARVKEHAHNQTLSTLYCKRLSRTDLLVEFKKTFLIVLGSILCKCCNNFRLLAEQIYNFCIRTDAKCTNQNRYRKFSGTVYTYIKYIIGVCLIFQPCTTVRDDRTGIELFAQLVMGNRIINTR